MKKTRAIALAFACVLCLECGGNPAKAQRATEIPPPSTGTRDGPRTTAPKVKEKPAAKEHPAREEESDAEEKSAREETPSAGERAEEEIEEALEEMRHLASALSGVLRERRIEFTAEWRKREARMQERMEALRKEGEELKGESRGRWATAMNAAESERQAFERQLDGLSGDMSGGWVSRRKDLREAWDELSEALDDVEAELRKIRGESGAGPHRAGESGQEERKDAR